MPETSAPPSTAPAKLEDNGHTTPQAKVPPPMSPFACFVNYRIEQLQPVFGTIVRSRSEFVRECLVIWQNMELDQKKPFEDMSAANREAHKEMYPNYVPERRTKTGRVVPKTRQAMNSGHGGSSRASSDTSPNHFPASQGGSATHPFDYIVGMPAIGSMDEFPQHEDRVENSLIAGLSSPLQAPIDEDFDPYMDMLAVGERVRFEYSF